MKSKVEANKIERLTAKPTSKAPVASPPAKKEAPKAKAEPVSRSTVGLADYTAAQLKAGKSCEEINKLATEEWPCIKQTPGWLMYFVHAKERLDAQAAKAAAKAKGGQATDAKTTKSKKG